MFKINDKVVSTEKYSDRYFESFEGIIKYMEGDRISILMNDNRSWIHIGKHIANDFLRVVE